MDDYRSAANINTFLRAFGIAQFTADALICNKVPFNDFLSFAKAEIGSRTLPRTDTVVQDMVSFP